MEKACGSRFFAVLRAAVSTAVLVAPACGSVTLAGPEQQQDLCTERACDAGGAARDDAAGCAARALHGDGNGNGNRGGNDTTAGQQCPGGGIADAGMTKVIGPPCALCRQAESCCRAERLTNCNYTAACTSATVADQTQFYPVLCRAVLEASSAGSQSPPDVCRSP